jgi:hypothetical protein
MLLQGILDATSSIDKLASIHWQNMQGEFMTESSEQDLRHSPTSIVQDLTAAKGSVFLSILLSNRYTVGGSALTVELQGVGL